MQFRILRIHLSTALLVMLLLSVLLGLNFVRNTYYTLQHRAFFGGSRAASWGEPLQSIRTRSYGWPLTVVSDTHTHETWSDQIKLGASDAEIENVITRVRPRELPPDRRIDYAALVGNIAIALLLLGALAYILERRIRRAKDVVSPQL